MSRRSIVALIGAPLALYLVAAGCVAVAYVSWGVPSETEVPTVGEVLSGRPAEAAGLREGDIIVAVDGQPIRSTAQVAPAIAAGGARVRIDVDREGRPQTFTVEPVDHHIGAELSSGDGYAPAPTAAALGEAALFPFRFMGARPRVLTQLSGGRSKSDLSGSIGIVPVSHHAGARLRWLLKGIVASQLLEYLLGAECVVIGIAWWRRRRLSRA